MSCDGRLHPTAADAAIADWSFGLPHTRRAVAVRDFGDFAIVVLRYVHESSGERFNAAAEVFCYRSAEGWEVGGTAGGWGSRTDEEAFARGEPNRGVVVHTYQPPTGVEAVRYRTPSWHAQAKVEDDGFAVLYKEGITADQYEEESSIEYLVNGKWCPYDELEDPSA